MRINNFESFMQDDEKRGGSSTMEYGYFSLKDGESATVRFMVDDVRQFDLELVHYVDVDGKNKKISCLGDGCPLCAAGVAQAKRFFIPMIKYSNGGATQEPVVWERNKDYALKLKNYINDYGGLSDILCNITRIGSGLETEYTISPNVHTKDAANYPKVNFPDVEPSKYCVSVKTADEMIQFIQTGKFPEKAANQSTQIPQDTVSDFESATVASQAPQYVEEEMPFAPQPQVTPIQPVYTQTTTRPQRY